MSLIDPNDPRLTAYALDEMSPREKAAFELQLRADPAAQATVEEIRKAAASLCAALEREPAPESVIEPPPVRVADSSRRLRRPWLVVPIPYFLGTVAAAALALAFFWHRENQKNEARLLLQERKMDLLLGASEQGAAAEKQAAALRTANNNNASSPSALAANGAPVSTASARQGVVEIGVPLDAVTPAATASSSRTGFDALVLTPVSAPVLQLPPRIPTTLPTAIASSHTSLTTSYNLFPGGAPAVVTFSKPIEISLQPDVAPARDTSGWSRNAVSTPVRSNTLNYSRTVAATPTTTAPAAATSANSTVDLNDARRAATKSAERSLATLPAFGASGASKFCLVSESPLSAFGVDAEVASLSGLRHFIADGIRPPASAVRIEDLLNAFPTETSELPADSPLGLNVEMHPAPWAPDHQLLRLNFRTRQVSVAERPAANLVLVVDVPSAATADDDALESARIAVRELLKDLRPQDRVALIAHDRTGTITAPAMPASESATLLDMLAIQKGGHPIATTMTSLHSAYQMARQEFLPRGLNRVVLFSRGGAATADQLPAGLEQLVSDHAQLGIDLHTVIVGGGAVHDSLLERLARRGQGRCVGAPTPGDAGRLGPQLALFTRPVGAEDVKVQIEFNPVRVQAYRQIGYESRASVPEGTSAPTPGESALVAGETVTVLYEIIPVESPFAPAAKAQALKYQSPVAVTEKVSDDWLTVNVRYRVPRGGAQEIARTLTSATNNAFPEMSRDFRFTAAAAAFGLLLRDSPDKGTTDWPMVESLAQESLGADAAGHRAEFLELVRRSREAAAKL